MDLREQMESIYRTMPLEAIPWNQSEPPEPLAQAVRNRTLKPCQAIDLGCGAGNYAVWLAQQGFEITGLDFSEEAISYAQELARRTGVLCRFEALDLLGDLSKFRSGFDFAYDWEVLHHIFPEDRPRYLQNVRSLLRPGGTYLSVCFSEHDSAFGGTGKYRKTSIGTTLYFSSEEELRELFAPFFDVRDLRTVTLLGKFGTHEAIVAWLVLR